MNVLEQLKHSLADRYEIEREIGAGGMATVYLARDLRHDRPVAVKVLNPDLGAVLGVERFLAEIKVTANLQHPNLLPLFDSGEAGGLLFYVMPYVDGESLRAKLMREKQLPIDEAVRISIAIASALDYAHSHGVIHRDLKPENVLMQSGQPVIADFGIALAVSKAGGNRVTQTGISLGTPQYMSPEQATGDRVIDGRSDIYSLAAMAYEMLTGEAPHQGNTAQAIIARVLTEKPRSIRLARESVPEHVAAAVEHGLEKLAADRYSTAREFAESIQGRGTMIARTAAVAATTAPRKRLRDPLVLGFGAVALVSAAAAILSMKAGSAEDATPPFQFVLATRDSTKPLPWFPWPAAISPDGSTIVFAVSLPDGGNLLYSQRTDQLDPRPIPGTNGGSQAFFSPNGQWLAFEAVGKERKVRLDGSAPVTIANGGANNGADWTVHDELVVGATSPFHGLARVSTAGGELIEFTHPDTAKGQHDHVWPIAAPDGKTIILTVWSGALATSELAVTNINDGKVSLLGVKGVRPLAVVDGVIVYVQADGAVMAVPFDGKSKIVGRAIPVHDPVPVTSGVNGNSGIFVSRLGAMISARGGAYSRVEWKDLRGARRNLLQESHAYFTPRLAPDGRHIAVGISDNDHRDVWMYDVETGTLSRLTSTEAVTSFEWSRDSKDILFTTSFEASRTAIMSQLAAGGSAPRLLIESSSLTPAFTASPDGTSFVQQELRGNTWDLVRVSADSPKVRKPYLTSPFNETSPGFSPDGRFVALVSDESGRSEVYVRSFPDPSARVQISVSGGSNPQWSADGGSLYYINANRLMRARLAVNPTFRVVSRDTLDNAFDALNVGFEREYDVSRDGSRVLALIATRDDYQLVVAPNWRTELRRRLAAAKSSQR